MSTLNTILLDAAQPGGGGMSSMFLILAMVVIFYFFMIRPQQRERKRIKKEREAMKKGDKVITSGGIHGIIREITPNYVLMEIDKGVNIKISIESIFPVPATDNTQAKGKKESEEKTEKTPEEKEK